MLIPKPPVGTWKWLSASTPELPETIPGPAAVIYYAWWKPGQLTDWQPELAKAEGRIHFAGEHTSVMGRTIEGALESGARAAREVHESV
jgi:monoamine oxidase